MAAIEKFRFDLSFDDADNVIRPSGSEEGDYGLNKKSRKKKPEEDAPPPPPPPIYTEEQMTEKLAEASALAREEGLAEGTAQGLEQGRQEILQSLDKTVSDTAIVLGGHLAHIDEQQKRANARIAEDSIHVARAIMRKIAPAWVAQNDLMEIEQIVRQCLSNLFDVPKVLVQVHPDIAAALNERITEIGRSRGFSGQLLVVGEAGVLPGDCRVSWGDGTAVRETAALWAEINDIVERAILAHRESHDLTASDMADPALQQTHKADIAAKPLPETTPDTGMGRDGNTADIEAGHPAKDDASDEDGAMPANMPTSPSQADTDDLNNDGNDADIVASPVTSDDMLPPNDEDAGDKHG
ncbi:MAG: FliH/SctL family protein [Pseudomonadota bacterium]